MNTKIAIVCAFIVIASVVEARPSLETSQQSHHKSDQNDQVQNQQLPRIKRGSYFTFEESSSSHQSSSSSYYRKISSSGPIAKTFVLAGNGRFNSNNFHFKK
ncbi:uncharacterized protein LOC123692074 [Colias croceus]|uniref:uncharacterized protein LOC123692074 n=1 Tax=Colias crocea TaxID=72248 RepID=UPI001E27A1BE|nr:uncharacterized protein LOC123692074 [Colias croceus]